MGTKRTWGIAAALLAASVAGSAARAQDAQTEERIKKQLEDKKRAQEANQKRGADADARSNETPEQRLARAKLLAESEHDYENALALVSRVANDEKVASELRAQGFVVAARCMNQLGRADEARAMLQKAAQQAGPAADEAKRLLDGGQTDQQLELRIAKAIEELFSNSAPANEVFEQIRTGQTARDLIWLGAPAVPRLVRVLGDADHLANVSGAAYLLAAINSEEVASALREAVRRSDPLYKRAILKGTMFITNKRAEPTRSAVMTMLQDPDARVREWMLVDARELAELSEVVPLTLDPEDRVRIAAWNALSVRNNADEKLVDALRRCLKEDHDPVRLAAVDLFGRDVNRALFRFASARTLFVESLLDPVLTSGQYWTQGWGAMGSGPNGVEVKIDSPVSIDLLVKVGNALGPVYRNDGVQVRELGDHRNRAWAGALFKSSQAVSPSDGRVGWPVEDREKVWPLLRLGVGSGITSWVAANARAEDLPVIAEHSVACGDVYVVKSAVERVIARPSSKQGEVEYVWTDLPREVRTSVANRLLPVFDADVASMDAAHPFQNGRLRTTTELLIRLGAAESDGALVRALQKAPEAGYVGWLLYRRDPPVDLARVAELVTIPIVTKDSQTLRGRNEALGRLAAGHVNAFSEVLARCYELGLEAAVSDKSRSTPCGIVWMVSTPPDASHLPPSDWAVRWAPAYSEAELRTAFEACAKVNSPTFWFDIRTAVSLLPEDGPFDPVGKTLLEIVARYLAGTTATSIKQSTRKDLIESLLRRRAPGWEELALAYLTDPDFASSVLSNLPAITPEMLARVAPSGDRAAKRSRDTTDTVREKLVDRMWNARDESIRARIPDYLMDPDSRVRVAALKATLSAYPDRALDLILPLAHDEDSGVRFALSESLGSVFDRRAIPVLVELLQDPSEGVRGVAKKSLDSLQYVFEQKEKWKRVLEGGGLDSANAAEALVKQAAAGQPKATRLVAIESLGTLGVAETLPVLIQFMGDGDAEVAAAAKDAVARINRQSKSGKDAKPPSDH
jgi:HEAT repeat protein